MAVSSSDRKDTTRNTTLGLKLYGIVGFVFLCFIALSVYELFHLKDALESQRSAELKHLTEMAIEVVQEEFGASQKGAIGVEEAKNSSCGACCQLALRAKRLLLDQ